MVPHLARHRVDLVALTFAVVFATEGVAALAQQLHWLHLHGRTWFGVVAVAIGLAGATGVTVATLRPHRGARATTPPTGPTPGFGG